MWVIKLYFTQLCNNDLNIHENIQIFPNISKKTKNFFKNTCFLDIFRKCEVWRVQEERKVCGRRGEGHRWWWREEGWGSRDELCERRGEGARVKKDVRWGRRGEGWFRIAEGGGVKEVWWKRRGEGGEMFFARGGVRDQGEEVTDEGERVRENVWGMREKVTEG